MSFLNYINPMSKFFLKAPEDGREKREFDLNLNRVGLNATDVGTSHNYMNWNWNTMEASGILFDGLTENKRQKIEIYREMALHPIVRRGLNIICDETITPNSKGEITKFDMKQTPLNKIQPVEFQDLKSVFDYTVDIIFGRERLWNMFYQWLVDSETFLEKVPASAGNTLAGVNQLPAYNTMPVFHNGRRMGFVQDPTIFETSRPQSESEPRIFNKESVAYSQYSFCGEAPVNNIYGHLEPVIRHLNLLKSIEDALAVWRVTRAPEKRIFKVYVGKTAPSQVGAKINKMKEEFNKELNLDPRTGLINTNKRVQSYTEDFYLPVFSNSEGSSVESFNSAAEFNGQIEDLKYAEKKVFDGLLIPPGRYSEEAATAYSTAPESAMTEISFQKMCHRLGKQFIDDIVLDVFITELKLRGYKEKFLDPDIYNIDFLNAQEFSRVRELAMAEKVGGIIGNFAQYMPTLENSKPSADAQRPLISAEYLFDNLIALNSVEKKKNQDALEKEMAELNKKADEAAAEGGSDEEDGDEF